MCVPKRTHLHACWGVQSALWALAFGVLSFGLLGLDTGALTAKATKTPKSGGGNPSQVIALVNQVRLNNGLPALTTNSALMAAAQGHSNYQASIGSITHSGSGGSDPKTRAVAAGYGGGAQVFVSENIYGGMGASPQQAVAWWQGDSLHLSTMLGSRYTDIGAGVATSGGIVYYTLDVGYVSGSPGSGGTSQPPNATARAATPVAFNPVQIATPLADGSIVHVVKAGQTLWTIAAIYKVNLQDLLKLNNLTNNPLIYPGEKILIRPPQASATPTASKTPPPIQSTATSPGAQTTLSGIEVGSQYATQDGAEDQSSNSQNRGHDSLLIVVVVFVTGGMLLTGLGYALIRRNQASQ